MPMGKKKRWTLGTDLWTNMLLLHTKPHQRLCL
jgi:hypothetical protein